MIVTVARVDIEIPDELIADRQECLKESPSQLSTIVYNFCLGHFKGLTCFDTFADYYGRKKISGEVTEFLKDDLYWLLEELTS